LLGYHVGLLCGSEIPLLCGLEETAPSRDDLKAFGATFTTTSATPMFHINQITPEAMSECAALASLCSGRRKHPDAVMAVTLGRSVYADASAAGYATTMERFGTRLINDACWCMLGEPVVPTTARTLMTNSGKYAYYAPGLAGCQMHFGNLTECVEAASYPLG
jgi:predicted aconitase